jgi:hypothetical protein
LEQTTLRVAVQAARSQTAALERREIQGSAIEADILWVQLNRPDWAVV